MATENQNGTGATEQPVDVVAPATAGAEETPVADPKGKGKAVATEPVQEDTAMDEDDDDEEDDEDEVSCQSLLKYALRPEVLGFY